MRNQATKTRRSYCPINASLETFGDSWSLLILRDIIYFGKKTFGEFLASDERIARNILADRLDQLQKKGLIVKSPHPTDKRKDIYEVTDAGLSVLPILLDMAEWGAQYDNKTTVPQAWSNLVRTRRAEVIRQAQKAVRAGKSIFVGKRNVYDQLVKSTRA